jgi:hypothetical protein
MAGSGTPKLLIRQKTSLTLLDPVDAAARARGKVEELPAGYPPGLLASFTSIHRVTGHGKAYAEPPIPSSFWSRIPNHARRARLIRPANDVDA